MKRSGDLPGYLGRNCCERVVPEFLATGPQIISRDCVGDPHVDAQHPLATAPLNAPINYVAKLGWIAQRKADATRLVRHPSERVAATVAEQARDQAIGKAFDQTLPIGLAGQIA